MNKDWNNFDNKAYYEIVPLEKQYGFSKLGGLDVYSDLELLKLHIKNSESILEVGACYGRVLEYLTKINYAGKITAIERSKAFFDILYAQHQKFAKLINEDIKQFKTSDQFDLILWVWCGISDFSKNEQPEIIKHLSDLLKKSGTLIIDTIDTNVKPLNVFCEISDTQNYILDIKSALLKGYIPSTEDIKGYIEGTGLKLIIQSYLTSTKRPRVFYFIRKLL